MRLLGYAFAIAFMGALAVAAVTRYGEHRKRAELDVDVSHVRDVAMQFSAHRCDSLPTAPVGLTTAATEVGVSGLHVGHPGRWSISLTARPGTRHTMGFALEALYAAGDSDWQITHLLERHGAVRTAAGVAIPLKRRRPSANRSGFQLLLEEKSC